LGLAGQQGPGGGDEQLVMYDQLRRVLVGNNWVDAGRDPWDVLQDVDGDIVALVNVRNGTPRVAAEWTFDAYGDVTNASTLMPHPALDYGHRAVFIDRLDVGVVVAGSAALGDGVAGLGEQRRLVPFATVVMHMRNRAYAPFTGRFLQRDMNATAAVVLGSMAHSRRGLAAGVSAFDAMELYGDGGSLYAYLGSSPFGRRDELGLRFGANLLGEAVLFGVRGLRGGLEGMLDQYSGNQEADLDWAMDWSQPDDAHTRSNADWVGESFYEGMMQGFREAFDDSTYGVYGLLQGGAQPQANAGASRWGQRTILYAGRIGKFTGRKIVDVPSGKYAVHFFTHPSTRNRSVIFPASAIQDEIKITIRRSPLEDIRHANRVRGKPANHNWAAELGFPHTWHHDHRKGVMYLIPRDLHEATKPHIGGGKSWGLNGWR